MEKVDSKHYIRNIAEKYSRVKDDGLEFPILQYVELMKLIYLKRDFDIFGRMTHEKCYSDISLQDRIAFVKGVIKLRHESRLKRHKFNFSFDEESGHLDLSNNPWMVTVLCLQNFPAKSVDLSKTGIINGIGLRAQILEKLNISSTKMIELQTIECKGLKELNLANCGIQNLHPVFDQPLEVLNIRNTGVRSLYFTTQMKKLKELHIDKAQFSEKEISRVPSQIKLVIH